jgi:TetR/AcrR family transcriptional regulator, cholesterol catabolism regulator
MPKGIPLTDEEQARRQSEISNAALRLFVEKGFNETSMREIAQAADAGKSTLYDYFKTKDDILASYFETEIRMVTEQAAAVIEKAGPAEEKLHQILLTQLKTLTDNKYFYLKLSNEVQRLSPASQKRLQVSRHRYQDMIVNLIQAGIAEGHFRPVDPYLAMRLILGALSPVAFTTRPKGTPEEMLSATLDIIFKGILA